MTFTLRSPDDHQPPCAGKWELFDAVDLISHHEAAALCEHCPIIERCRTTLEATQAAAYNRPTGPRGTWAGTLISPGLTKRPAASRATLDAEEAEYDEQAAIDAHRRFLKGSDDPRDAVGERVYQRRTKRRSVARQKGAA